MIVHNYLDIIYDDIKLEGYVRVTGFLLKKYYNNNKFQLEVASTLAIATGHNLPVFSLTIKKNE